MAWLRRRMADGVAATPVEVVDTTLRDGQMCLWATNLTTAEVLAAARWLDGAGFAAAEIVSDAFFKKCARDLRENVWERLDAVRRLVPRTPLRAIASRHVTFHPVPLAIWRLWAERLAAHGIRQVRISDPSNTVEELARRVAIARAAGLEPIVNLIFSRSPKHTDAYYADRLRALRQLPAAGFCLKDPGGLLTPARTEGLCRKLLEIAGTRRVELHSHCSNGLGHLNALAAVAAGVRIVNAAVAPLAEGASLPDVERLAVHLRALGYQLSLDDAAVARIREQLQAFAPRYRSLSDNHGLAAAVAHQIPGGMISNFRSQLARAGMEERLPAVLEEVSRVREDLGYPIMVTPYSQIVGVQAVLNVVTGERYREVTDELIGYALGHFGREEAEAIRPDVRDRILGRRRARELAQAPPVEETDSPRELRRRLGVGPEVDDDTWLLQWLAGGDALAGLKGQKAPMAAAAPVPLSSLLAAMRQIPFAHLELHRPGLRLVLMRSQRVRPSRLG